MVNTLLNIILLNLRDMMQDTIQNPHLPEVNNTKVLNILEEGYELVTKEDWENVVSRNVKLNRKNLQRDVKID